MMAHGLGTVARWAAVIAPTLRVVVVVVVVPVSAGPALTCPIPFDEAVPHWSSASDREGRMRSAGDARPGEEGNRHAAAGFG